MNLLVKNITIDQIKKVAILLGRDFAEIEKAQKEKGITVKTDAQLLAEIKAETDKKINEKEPKKK
jgi:hypothetical protein